MSDLVFTGQLEKVRVCHIQNSDIVFLFGYIVEHQSEQYENGDWFASSFIVNVTVTDDYYIFQTNNSSFKVKDYVPLIVIDESTDNIRTGMPPEMEVKSKTPDEMITLMSSLG